MEKIYLSKWFEKRDPRFIWRRLLSLLTRYGLFSGRVAGSLYACLDVLKEFECKLTFFVPAVILERYPKVILKLKDAGSEIDVHGFRHVDLSQIPVEQACEMLERAVRTFENYGIRSTGFRCPYLGCNDDLLKAIPSGLFNYSSNMAISWDDSSPVYESERNEFSNSLRKIYLPISSQDTICIPWMHFGLVEIPVCIPEDLDLHDGYNKGAEEIAQFWCQLLHKIHARGELFTLLFHSETALLVAEPLKILFKEIQNLRSSVWIASLSEISDWWLEKAKFEVKLENAKGNLHVTFNGSPRATILTRGLDLDGDSQAWDERYYRLTSKELQLPPGSRPFIGLSPSTPEGIISFLQNQGYILDMSALADRCAIFIDQTILLGLATEVQLVNYIEGSDRPLIKFGHWPDGARSALNVSVDLDALSLFDYASRLWGK